MGHGVDIEFAAADAFAVFFSHHPLGYTHTVADKEKYIFYRFDSIS